MKIGYLGPKGSYSYEATLKYTNNLDTLVEYPEITKVIEAVYNDEIQKCVVPLENAIHGSVTDTMDSILKYKDIYITDELILDIKHQLMAKTKDSRISKIYSHSQALAQCQKYLKKNYHKVEEVPVSSTSYAASLASKDSNVACICNSVCKDIYNLEIIANDIQDIEYNQTRFIVLSKTKNTKNTNKTSIVFSTKDEPGALYNILGLFSLSKINLTKIESRPAKTKLGEYMFFVNIDGDEKEEKISNTFKKIEEFCTEFRVIGSY